MNASIPLPEQFRGGGSPDITITTHRVAYFKKNARSGPDAGESKFEMGGKKTPAVERTVLGSLAPIIM